MVEATVDLGMTAAATTEEDAAEVVVMVDIRTIAEVVRHALS